MTRIPTPPEGLTPDESRYVDGEMSKDEARRMKLQLAADPLAAARVEAWRAAMDVWRDDASRTSAAVAGDADALADRVLAGLASRRPAALVLPGARWYAAAAMLLMAVGVTGTIVSLRAGGGVPAVPPQVAGVDEIFLDAMAEGSEFAPGLALPNEGR